MNKLIKILAVAVIAVVAAVMVITSCSEKAEKQDELAKIVEEMNDVCPVDLDVLGQIISFKYDRSKEEIVTTYSINKEFGNILSSYTPENMHTLMKLGFYDPELQEFIELSYKAGVSIKTVYKTVGNKSHSFVLTQDDLADILKYPLTDKERNELMLSTSILSAKNICPYKIDVATTMTDVSLDDEKVMYTYSIDESRVNMRLIILNKTQLKDDLRQWISDNVVTNQLISQIKATGRRLVYEYVGDRSGDTFTIEFSNDEL